MAKLGELASLIRSKNAGPFQLTFDIMFNDPAVYERVKRSGVVSREAISRIYRLPQEQVLFFFVDNALAIKASIPRPIFQGDVGDTDSHGGQQYAPLITLNIP
ncbi:DUF4387 domain-containing protein [Halomonas salipaludis]|uniref:Acyl-CoA synthetase n=1 Tax=Halomonas salipaludis TaxID=2032625 RepID=A0A2A2ESY2_9GAMM|nr:DUF4387 domain-containing protein [Halomonas salipaludis]PAU75584.1 acyl-CoA synthetase [Halomonas salipaludis]